MLVKGLLIQEIKATLYFIGLTLFAVYSVFMKGFAIIWDLFYTIFALCTTHILSTQLNLIGRLSEG